MLLILYSALTLDIVGVNRLQLDVSVFALPFLCIGIIVASLFIYGSFPAKFYCKHLVSCVMLVARS